jgi:Ca2+-transporting ATPase
MVLYVPSLSRLFQFAPLYVPDLVLCLVAGVVTTVWFELVKVFKAGRRRSLAGRGPLTQQG